MPFPSISRLVGKSVVGPDLLGCRRQHDGPHFTLIASGTMGTKAGPWNGYYAPSVAALSMEGE